jgi:hypothetical protein
VAVGGGGVELSLVGVVVGELEGALAEALPGRPVVVVGAERGEAATDLRTDQAVMVGLGDALQWVRVAGSVVTIKTRTRSTVAQIVSPAAPGRLPRRLR